MTGAPGGPAAVVVLVTAPSEDVARALARDLVESRLAACVNVVRGVTSIYRWEGKIEEGSETLLIVKTTAARADLLTERIGKLHPYDVPEILALPVARGERAWLDWLAAAVSPE